MFPRNTKNRDLIRQWRAPPPQFCSLSVGCGIVDRIVDLPVRVQRRTIPRPTDNRTQLMEWDAADINLDQFLVSSLLHELSRLNFVDVKNVSWLTQLKETVDQICSIMPCERWCFTLRCTMRTPSSRTWDRNRARSPARTLKRKIFIGLCIPENERNSKPIMLLWFWESCWFAGWKLACNFSDETT